MIRIAIAEDNRQDAQRLQNFLARYQQEQGVTLHATVFADGLDLLEQAEQPWDIIFLDIQMTHLDGMKTAQKLRETDPNVVLIFITSMARYAVQGYQVNALDYLIKPVDYTQFTFSMAKALAVLERNQRKYLMLPMGDQRYKVPCNDILYMEVLDHDLHIVTPNQTYVMRGSLNEMERGLEGCHFARCSHSFLVNLGSVVSVGRDTVQVPGHELPISRPKRKQFLQALSDYLGVEL
jgi:DNA-binding LytR/AlgR family response regulator